MSETTITNQSYWLKLKDGLVKSYQEVWYLKLNDPKTQKALWLRFTLLLTKSGYKKIAETWAIFFQKKEETGEIQKTALKQTFPISEFSSIQNENLIKIIIGNSFLTSFHTKGQIQAKGQSLEWDLDMKPLTTNQFDLVPSSLSKSKLVKNTALTVYENLSFSGDLILQGEKHRFENAPGMQGHLAGTKNGHSWVWAHCNYFLDDHGNRAPVVFEGLSARAKLPFAIPSPKLSTFYFLYRENEFPANTLWSAIRSKSTLNFTEWSFETEHRDLEGNNLIFKGQIKAELKSFAGITYEDTDGSFLYCANSKLAEMILVVFRNGKPEARFYAPFTAAYECVSRQKNPYVAMLI
ncbi:MAG: hypothetical protein HY843_00555 [Bdellovibrio sp.]|nr:hypothetical protein [Bdellovibrio sp.]